MKYSLYLILTMVVMSLVACNNDTSLPTLIPESGSTVVPEAVSTDTPAVINTPTVTQIVPTATQRVRPTLPPTYTPTFTITPSPAPTDITPTATIFNPSAQLPDACENFAVVSDSSDIEFKLGTDAQIAWTAIEGATQYSITLEDDVQRVLLNNVFIAETTYTLPADLFEEGKFYGWKVYPLDVNLVQMCTHIGAELIPVRR